MAVYLDYLMGTVSGYNKAVRRKLLDIIVTEGIATREENVSLLEEDVALGAFPEDIRLVECLKKSKRAVKLAECFEYTKSYRYSVAMKLGNSLEADKIAELTSAGILIEFKKENTDLRDVLGTITEMPTTVGYVNAANEYRFKIGLKVEKYDAEGNVIYRKFPVLGVLHNTSNLIEIRYDSIPNNMSSNDLFYVTCINKAINWIESILALTIVNRDAPSDRMHYIVDNRDALRATGEVIVTGQGMKFGNGSSADLFVGNAESGVLPLIGELRQFLSDNEEAFKEAPELQKALEDFLAEKEQDSDWPWMSLRLTYRGKKIEIKYTTEMYGMGMCRIMFIDNTKYNAEAMSYAINYITENSSDHPAS